MIYKVIKSNDWSMWYINVSLLIIGNFSCEYGS